MRFLLYRARDFNTSFNKSCETLFSLRRRNLSPAACLHKT
jgi:hypothetical protein